MYTRISVKRCERLGQPIDSTYSSKSRKYSRYGENTKTACPKYPDEKGEGGRVKIVVTGGVRVRVGRGCYAMTQPLLLYPEPLAFVLSDTRAAS